MTKWTPEPWEIVMEWRSEGIYCIGIRSKTTKDYVCQIERHLTKEAGITFPNGGPDGPDAKRLFSCINALAGLNPEGVRELVEAVTRVCDIMKQQQKSPKKKSDKYLSVYYRACLENSERFIRTALAAVRLK